MLAPRSIDDLILSAEGEVARAAAMAAIVDGIPVDLDPLPPDPAPEPLPEPLSEYVERRRRIHGAAMRRAFEPLYPRRRGQLSHLRGTTPAYADTAQMAWALGDECEAAPDLCLPVLPDPEIGPDGIVWGARVTMRACPPIDPECAFESREPAALPPTQRGEEPTDPTAVDVAAWLEGLSEPMTVFDLAELTGHDRDDVARACQQWRWAGRVAKQQTNDEPLWVWRRAAL